MGSKYDRYWSDRLSELSRAAVTAADGKVAILNIEDLTNLGTRQSWTGNVRVRGNAVLASHMAHAASLARVATEAGLFATWPTREFVLSLNTHTLTMRLAPPTPAAQAHAAPLATPPGASGSRTHRALTSTASAPAEHTDKIG
jgi:hypothetical protein